MEGLPVIRPHLGANFSEATYDTHFVVHSPE